MYKCHITGAGFTFSFTNKCAIFAHDFIIGLSTHRWHASLSVYENHCDVAVNGHITLLFIVYIARILGNKPEKSDTSNEVCV